MTKAVRLSLIYQMKILEKLYPEEAEVLWQNRTALEEGFMLEYKSIFESLSDELSEGECRAVIDILDMYRALTFSLRGIEKSDDLQSHHLAKFAGFDGINEGRLMNYAHTIVDSDRYNELKKGKFPPLDSHTQMLPTYQEMFKRWNQIGKSSKMSRDQIASVLSAQG
jgi:uncharacterized protein